MPPPALSGAHRICTFGGLALPNGQGTMLPLNLNDLTSWYLQDEALFDVQAQLTAAQQVYQGEGAVLATDFPPIALRVPMEYREGPVPLGATLPKLVLAGEQRLAFDSNTCILARCVGTSSRQTSFRVLGSTSVIRWTFDLNFLCREPWWRDVTASTLAAVPIVNPPPTAPSGAVAAGGALATGTYTLQYTYVTASGETAPSPASSNIVLTSGNQQITVTGVSLPSFATAVKWYFASGPTTGFTVQNSGSGFTLNTAGNGTPAPTSTPATTFNVSYAGSVWARPAWTLTIPSGNAAPIQSFSLSNTMSGESLSVTFPGSLAASTAWTITIDAGKLTVSDQNGGQYDFFGSFPALHEPAGQVNPMSATLTPASGTATGCTIGASYSNRWLL